MRAESGWHATKGAGSAPAPAPTFFVLSRPFDARHRPWKGSAETETFDAAQERMTRLGAHRRIESQVVASSALTPGEIDRYRSDIAARRRPSQAGVTAIAKVVPITTDPLVLARAHFEVGREEFLAALRRLEARQALRQSEQGGA